MAFRALTPLALAAVTLLSGCSMFRSYDTELQATNQQLATGNVDAALTLLEKNNTGPDKDLLYYFEKGELLRAKGDLNGSQAAWGHADQVVGNWEDSVKLDTDKYLAQFGSFLVNDKVRRYEGYDYEKVMLTTQMALNQLAVNDFDGARADIKKTHEREALIARQREKQYEEAEEQAKTHFPQASVRAIEKPATGYQEVLAGRAVATITSNVEAATLVKTHPSLTVISKPSFFPTRSSTASPASAPSTAPPRIARVRPVPPPIVLPNTPPTAPPATTPAPEVPSFWIVIGRTFTTVPLRIT